MKNNNPQLTNACMDAVRWYGAFTEWLLSSIPRDESVDVMKSYRLIFENNHLKLSEIEQHDPEYINLVEGNGILSSEFKEWRKKLSQKTEQA